MAQDDVVEERIKVFVRCRPPHEIEDLGKDCAVRSTFLTPHELRDAERLESCLSDWTPTSCVFQRDETSKAYNMDGFFEGSATQADVYDACARRVVELAARGHEGTLIAYGQTGSGKTWTMRGGSGDERGILPRTLEALFEARRTQHKDGARVSLSLSYVQLYCEVLTDLLSSQSKALTIREKPAHEGGGVFVEGLCRAPIENADEALALILSGDARRFTAATPYNASSSRSHAVAIIHIERVGDEGTAVRRSALTLVDLAGSEKSALLRPQRLEECKAINLSLAALGNCVAALAQQRPHVPYRDSKLTRLLQNSLGGNAVTSLVATVDPYNSSASETKATLDFAARAAQVHVRAEPRDIVVDYRRLYDECRAQLDASVEKIASAELEAAKWRREAETQTHIVADVSTQRDDLLRRLDITEKRLKDLREVDGTSADAIEAVHAEWEREAASADDRHAASLVVAQAKAEARLRAYRAAAEAATNDGDRAQEDLIAERVSHLETLAALRAARAQVDDHTSATNQRISDLLVEVNERRDNESELQAKLAKAEKAADEAAQELDRRVAALEAAGQTRLRDLETNYVSRDRVSEMERLFHDAVELLAARLDTLERKRIDDLASGKARHNMSHAARDLLAHLEGGPQQGRGPPPPPPGCDEEDRLPGLAKHRSSGAGGDASALKGRPMRRSSLGSTARKPGPLFY